MPSITRNTKDWQAIDVAHHLHPFTDPKYFDSKAPLVVTRAQGSHVWDSDGRKILDGMAGLWCVNVGYGRQELIDASHRQMQELAYYNVFFQSATPPQIELSRVLAELTPGDLNHFFFTNSGSEANDTVIRMVRHFWEVEGKPEKHIFIGRTLGYHGSTVAATSLGGMQNMHDMGKSLLPGFEHVMHPHWYALGGDLGEEEFGVKAAQALEDKILELGAGNIAAFVAEPVQGAGGVIDPPKTYWPEIQRICRKYDILLVADEVICGFGRLGHWFGSEAYGIEPDLMPMAKGLSSGYLPIAAVAYSARMHKTLQRGGVFSHGYTYSGHPVSCAVALANIQLIKDEGLIEKVHNETAPYFRQRLEDVVAEHRLVGEVRGAGLLAGVQLVKDKQTRALFNADQNVAMKCRDHCLDGGLIMRAVGQSMVASPPLIITKDEIDELIAILLESLDRTAADLGIV
ncbi:aspartate aminotransferase family protein [Kordiimonas sp.]|uniref:aspartate aminotransferase family protein n=1 Tax=Kordiimonas sp. TaxID=1970157 RepID=UPI003A9445AB